MIEVRGLKKTFDGFAALDGADLSVPRGAVYGLVGPNGAGKTTLLRHLTGVYHQDSGSVRFDGEEVWENVDVKARIASIPDDWFYFMQAGLRDMMRFYRGCTRSSIRSALKSSARSSRSMKSGRCAA